MGNYSELKGKVSPHHLLYTHHSICQCFNEPNEDCSFAIPDVTMRQRTLRQSACVLHRWTFSPCLSPWSQVGHSQRIGSACCLKWLSCFSPGGPFSLAPLSHCRVTGVCISSTDLVCIWGQKLGLRAWSRISTRHFLKTFSSCMVGLDWWWNISVWLK